MAKLDSCKKNQELGVVKPLRALNQDIVVRVQVTVMERLFGTANCKKKLYPFISDFKMVVDGVGHENGHRSLDLVTKK
jgi:hypothetical protein